MAHSSSQSPKSLSELAFEQDWYIDDSKGIQVHQFDRPFANGTYRMLHMVMTLRRQSPPIKARGPGQRVPQSAADAQKRALHKFFQGEVKPVEDFVKGDLANELEADLKKLFKHRERYYVPPTE